MGSFWNHLECMRMTTKPGCLIYNQLSCPLGFTVAQRVSVTLHTINLMLDEGVSYVDQYLDWLYHQWSSKQWCMCQESTAHALSLQWGRIRDQSWQGVHPKYCTRVPRHQDWHWSSSSQKLSWMTLPLGGTERVPGKCLAVTNQQVRVYTYMSLSLYLIWWYHVMEMISCVIPSKAKQNNMSVSRSRPTLKKKVQTPQDLIAFTNKMFLSCHLPYFLILINK